MLLMQFEPTLFARSYRDALRPRNTPARVIKWRCISERFKLKRFLDRQSNEILGSRSVGNATDARSKWRIGAGPAVEKKPTVPIEQLKFWSVDQSAATIFTVVPSRDNAMKLAS